MTASAFAAPPAGWAPDHLVFAAADLASGQAWLEAQLGVPLQPGGQHPRFGTHNRLLGLSLAGNSRCYLEVIAADPAAPAPTTPRWFELDTPAMQARIAGRPRLIHWVAAVPSLAGHPAAIPLTRGQSRWQLTVPPDGSLPGGGPEPSLIAWDTPSPAQTLPDSGVCLERLELCGPRPERLHPWAGTEHGAVITVQPAPQPGLQATFGTPEGPVTLD
ncbi:VOC family protein [Deinococcus sp. Marseille-Q6407]|uniref:VOC family protein n=1 Tax=Deinococcus sp. Marseille-Q6407 TaxID=2969223 RepID=UPI0021BF9509|nr:VOC family protein [Deinococcus sp. Marseille-Q6407]